MAKVVIDKSTAWGNLVATAIQHIADAKTLLGRAQAASVIAQQSPTGSPAGSAALEGSMFGFGGGSGQGPDYASALQNLQTKIDTFVVTTAAGEIATLDNGNLF